MLSLLIFFLLVSKAGIDTGADQSLELPLASLGITQEDLDEERSTNAMLVLNIDPAPGGDYPRVYGKFFSTGKEFSYTDQAELRQFLATVKGGRSDWVVAVHADAGTPFHRIEPVLQAVNTAQPAQVRFAFNPSAGR